MARRYSDGFKKRMVQRLSGPRAVSASALAKETGVPQPTLSRWLREAATLPAMSDEDDAAPAARRPADWSAEEKLEAVLESEGLSDDELGLWLRRKGVTETQLGTWRTTVLEALSRRRGKVTEETKQIRRLEKELRRKEKALAEAAALLTLRGKLQALWGDDEDEPTRQQSAPQSSNRWRSRSKKARR